MEKKEEVAWEKPHGIFQKLTVDMALVVGLHEREGRKERDQNKMIQLRERRKERREKKVRKSSSDCMDPETLRVEQGESDVVEE